MLPRILLVFGFAAMLAAGASQTRASVSFDTTPYWNGVTAIYPWGPSDTATYGQTFIAPVGAPVLNAFTFHITGNGPQPTVTFQADVFAWSGSLLGAGGGGAIGPALFTQSNMTLTDTGAFQAVTVNTGNLVLTPGNQYVALFTISDPASQAANTFGNFLWGDTGWGQHVPNNGGGGFVFDNNASDYLALNTTNWDNFADYGDSAWDAFFSTIPEPGTVTLVGLSIVGLHAISRRKK